MDVLVISATYEPLQRIGWQRAIQLWYAGRVEVVEAYPDRIIRSVSMAIRMPAVVRFGRARPVRRRKARFSRRNVFARDRGCCQYCKKRLTLKEATYDHVVPRCRGGRTHWENIVISCRTCNQLKGGRMPDMAGMYPACEPVKPRRLDTFKPEFMWRKGMPDIWRPYLRGG